MPPGRFCDCHCREEQAIPVSNERLKPPSSPYALGEKIQADSADCHNIEFMTPLGQSLVVAPFEYFCDYQARHSSTLDDILAQARAQNRSIPVEERFRVASRPASGVLCVNSILNKYLIKGISSFKVHYEIPKPNLNNSLYALFVLHSRTLIRQ